MSFCNECGSEKKLEWTGKYSEQDGSKVMIEICSKNPCEHNGHNYIRIQHESFFRALLASFLGRELKCHRCGSHSSMDYGC